MVLLCVTRFNDTTWAENKGYREKNNITGCIYPCPVRISNRIALHTTIIVFEMNNETNTIMGIGMIKNYLRMDKTHKVYSCTTGSNNANYNRYTYKGKKYFPRESLGDDEIQQLKKVEYLVFKGKDHIKRGQGIQMIPAKKLVGTSYERYFTEMFSRG